MKTLGKIVELLALETVQNWKLSWLEILSYIPVYAKCANLVTSWELVKAFDLAI